MRRGLIVVAAFVAASSWAQESKLPVPPPPVESGSLASIPVALLGEALTVSVAASIGKPSEPPSWESKDIKYTIPGTSVSARLIGTDVAIIITVTPYKNKDGGLLLVAQGQVWYKDGDAGLRYRTAVDTLSIQFGESVLFYPFGTRPDGGSPLRIELVMDKYAPPLNTETGNPVQPSDKEKAGP